EGREKHRRQDRDDGDDNQQFDQCESPLFFRAHFLLRRVQQKNAPPVWRGVFEMNYCANRVKNCLGTVVGSTVTGALKLPALSKLPVVTTVHCDSGNAMLVVLNTLIGPLGRPLLAFSVIVPLENALKSALNFGRLAAVTRMVPFTYNWVVSQV